MWPASATFLDALHRSHQAVAAVEVYDQGQPVATLLPVDGHVEVDGGAAVRRRCQLELVDPTGDLTPRDLADLLGPAGNELRVHRGIRQPDGTDELVPLGVFGIADVEVKHDREGVRIGVEGYDRSRKVSKARWDEPHIIPSGTNYATAIRDLIDSRLPGLTYAFTPTTRTTPLIVLGLSVDNDPWDDASRMAAAIGCEILFGPAGVCTLRPLTDATTAPPVFTYDATMLAISRRISDERTYNRVVVTGESPDATAPVRVVVDDDDPASPTWVGDPPGSSDFGLRPYFLTSQLITDSDQAQDAAEGLLVQVTGVVEDVRFDAIVNPAHDAGDVVDIVDPTIGVASRYQLDAFTIPLRADQPMPATTRKRRVTSGA